jgi:AcrR family transcriptional regulator
MRLCNPDVNDRTRLLRREAFGRILTTVHRRYDVTAVLPEAPALLPACPELSDARRRLFEAAIVLFGERGFHAVSVRDLAQHLGLQPTALYAHVGSKQELLFEIMLIGYRSHRDRVKAALLDAGREPADQIAAIARGHVLAHLDFPALARVTNRELAALDADQTAAVLAVRRESEQMFLDVVDRGVRLGDFTVAVPGLAIHAVAAMGIRTVEWWTPDSPYAADEVADNFAAYAVRLLT